MIEQLQRVMNEEGINPTKELLKEIFHFATTLIPYISMISLSQENHSFFLHGAPMSSMVKAGIFPAVVFA